MIRRTDRRSTVWTEYSPLKQIDRDAAVLGEGKK